MMLHESTFSRWLPWLVLFAVLHAKSETLASSVRSVSFYPVGSFPLNKLGSLSKLPLGQLKSLPLKKLTDFLPGVKPSDIPDPLVSIPLGQLTRFKFGSFGIVPLREFPDGLDSEPVSIIAETPLSELPGKLGNPLSLKGPNGELPGSDTPLSKIGKIVIPAFGSISLSNVPENLKDLPLSSLIKLPFNKLPDLIGKPPYGHSPDLLGKVGLYDLEDWDLPFGKLPVKDAQDFGLNSKTVRYLFDLPVKKLPDLLKNFPPSEDPSLPRSLSQIPDKLKSVPLGDVIIRSYGPLGAAPANVLPDEILSRPFKDFKGFPLSQLPEGFGSAPVKIYGKIDLGLLGSLPFRSGVPDSIAAKPIGKLGSLLAHSIPTKPKGH